MGWLTRDQIKDNLIAIGKQDIADILDDVAVKFEYYSLDKMRYSLRDGSVSDEEYQAYCYLWRNANYRISNECKEYELAHAT